MAALSLTACDVFGPCGDVCTTSAIVYGHVTTASGVPVVDARVHIDACFIDRGSGEYPAGSTGVAWLRTDAAGRYRDQPRAPVGPFRARLVVRVALPASSGRGEVVDGGAEVQFREDYRSRGRDSVRVDVIVPDGTRP